MESRTLTIWILLILLAGVQYLISIYFLSTTTTIKVISYILAFIKFILVGFFFMELYLHERMWKRIFLTVSILIFTILIIITSI